MSSLKKIHSIEGDFSKFKKTANGLSYIQIGNTLLGKKGDGTYITHSPFVTNFEVVGDFVYVHEKLSDDGINTVNAYKGLFQIQPDFTIDGKRFINEPFISYLNDLDKEVELLEENNGDIFITVRDMP